MIFLVNLPLGGLALLVGARVLPAAPSKASGERLDFLGMGLAAVAMLLLVFPLVQGHQLGWPPWLVAMLIGSFGVLGVFARHQLRRVRHGRTPLVEPSIFKHRAYAVGVLCSLVFVASIGGIVLIFNVFLQTGLGFSPWHSAITTAPWAAGAFIGSGISSAVMQKLGRKVLQAGLVIEAVGLCALYGVLQSAGNGVGSLDLLAPMIVGGLGMGMVFVPLFDIVIAGVAPHEMGSASGVLQAVNSLGMSVGVAGIGAIFFGLVGAGRVGDFVDAAQWAAVVTIALLGWAFVAAFWLPRRAHETAPAPAGDLSLAEERKIRTPVPVAA